MTQILAFSAKKQGGKTTASNFLFGVALMQLEQIDHFSMSETGKLVVPAAGGKYMELDLASTPRALHPQMMDFMRNNVWPAIKTYNFADPLKDYCIRLFGLTWEQCYGTDEDKNTPTTLKWENMPIKVKNKSGFMSAREVLQYWGTEVMRSIDDDIWVKSTLRQIESESPQIALIGDARFPNEVEGIQKAGGKVLRLTRNSESTDKHKSETALDKEKFDWEKFDAILDNSVCSIPDQCNQIMEKMIEWKIFEAQVENVNGTFTGAV